ncbi:hypothetical protein BKA61DRAFT_583600 [Leptodontidium sp. MPI-SDFR-AT-0119]|nr:hypothetical protein BKA61DRAFT_583600 [Leptodontidium sp. MPI-SDFR-AT-0119]
MALYSSTNQHNYNQWRDNSQSQSISLVRSLIALPLATIEPKFGHLIMSASSSYRPRNSHAPVTRTTSNLHAPKTASRHLDREIKVNQVTAAKKLKSGDIIIYTSTMEGAEKLKGKREWLSTLGTKAEVLEETYRVLVYGVPANRVNVNNQAQVIKQIKMENIYIIKVSSLIVEFTKPEHANIAINEGLIIEVALPAPAPQSQEKIISCKEEVGSQTRCTKFATQCANAKKCIVSSVSSRGHGSVSG